ncbi:hypothetical protein LCI18_008309 [Fusarium solani-melongenae]|uniref:Uncharacterized protein n=1 Tax=Fusarium solani subsp. cucurbitae TaxID=2747967 RepID=A0ACD3Z7W5_FUSSC|nr:hypothetical protein LCI18_008309 [Fusarium solani-melongenae]
MPVNSKRALRVTGMPGGTTIEQHNDFVQSLSELPHKGHHLRLKSIPLVRHLRRKKDRTKSSEPSQDNSSSKDESIRPLIAPKEPQATSFSFQNDCCIGTIAYSTHEVQVLAQKRHDKAKKDPQYLWRDWQITPSFQGITVLFQHAEVSQIKMDICAIHGLGGNAIDTWTAKNGKMWLRDYLPSTGYFDQSRIMTFGYDSDLTSKESVMTVDSWADSLLEYLSLIRKSQNERDRPLLLVCHSLGGLVAKKALSKLASFRVPGVELSQVGVVFLATPHIGSSVADWNDFAVAAAGVFLGVRSEIVNALKAFGDSAVEDGSAFLALSPRPPFRCFAEGRKMDTKIGLKHVVSKASATLDPRSPAHVIMGTDHKTICKFDSNLDAFMIVNSALNDVYTDIMARSIEDWSSERRMYGHPRFVAHAYPPQSKYWWEGPQLKDMDTFRGDMFGRAEELTALEGAVSLQPTRRKLTAIKGMAGIGKTELLLKFALAQKGRRNIFFLGRQSERASLSDLITEICTSIGRDVIVDPSTNLKKWQDFSPLERIRLFATWLGHESNRDSLLIIDDADTFPPSSLKFVLSCPAWHIVTSTRDSTVSWTKRECLEVRLQPLTTCATVSVLQDSIAKLSSGRLELSNQELNSLAQIIHGHPLAAQNVIPFLVTHLNFIPHPVAELMRMFHTGSVEEREVFLKFTAQGRSLWDTFEESLQRLELRDGSGNAVRLFQLLPYLRTDQQCFHDCWRMNTGRRHQPSSLGSHASVLRSSHLVMSDWLQRLQAVSFITEEREGGSIQSIAFHPLVRHYALVRFHQAELKVAREIILFLHEKAAAHGDGCPGYIKTHLLYYVGVCSELHIGLCDLGLPEATRLWLWNIIEEQSTGDSSHDEVEGAFSEPVAIDQTTLAVQHLLAECKNTHTRLRKDIPQADNHEAQLMAIRCTKAYREMRESFDSIDSSLDPDLLSQLREAVELLREVCKAIGHYPDLPCELERFGQQLQAKIPSGSGGASDWHR